MTTNVQTPETDRDLRTLLSTYEQSLNAADVARIVELYAPDAVFMAQHREPAQGHEAIRAAYTQIFGAIRLNIRFEIDELVQLTPTMAYARTRSAGTTTIQATQAQVQEGNQELFLLSRATPTVPWKIHRYIFSTTRPM